MKVGYEAVKVRPNVPDPRGTLCAYGSGTLVIAAETDRHAGNVQPRITQATIVLQKHSDASVAMGPKPLTGRLIVNVLPI